MCYLYEIFLNDLSIYYLHNSLNSSATNCTCVPTITCKLFLPGLITPETPADLMTFSLTFAWSFISKRNLVTQLSIDVIFSFPPTPSKILAAI